MQTDRGLMRPQQLARRWAIAAGQKGQSLVEFAFVMPVLLVLLFTVGEFGFILSDQISLTHAARDGAHAGAAPHGLLPAALSAAQSDATTQAQMSVKPPDGNGANPTNCSSPTVTTATSGTGPYDLQVTVSCSYSFITPLGPLLGLIGGSMSSTLPLTAQATYRVQQ